MVARTRSIASTAGSSGSKSLVDDRGSLFCIHTHFDVAGRRPVPGEAVSISTALTTVRRGTVFLSLVCFQISYIVVADLAHIAGLGPEATCGR
ncbi:MAG: hypothetical protein QME72_06490 [Rhodococcus sp. (in: high G+C Gram-positive bacteria)]|nr:hypothetical protein [Rhodococcus sp. (in: high G+C Gram-positive bacteria)]MDI6627349.1 hypothetical protein [Rhodococcus sp. (in: high G+C Gram-positive bacteria)]